MVTSISLFNPFLVGALALAFIVTVVYVVAMVRLHRGDGRPDFLDVLVIAISLVILAAIYSVRHP